MTGAGIILGTAAYMAPEQAKGLAADKRSDIWAFGCVLFEMLTARRPFDGEDTTDVLGAVVRLEPPWEALPSDVPAPVRTLLRQCLVKDRRRRVADIAAVQFVLDHQATLTPPPVVASGSARVAWLIAALSAIALIGAALGWLRAIPSVTRRARSHPVHDRSAREHVFRRAERWRHRQQRTTGHLSRWPQHRLRRRCQDRVPPLAAAGR